MDWKAILTGVVISVLGMIVYNMFVKQLITNELESYLDYDPEEFHGYTEKLAA